MGLTASLKLSNGRRSALNRRMDGKRAFDDADSCNGPSHLENMTFFEGLHLLNFALPSHSQPGGRKIK